MLFPTLVDFNWQKFKSDAARAFTPEEKVEIALFWYKNKGYSSVVATISSTLRRVWHGISWSFPAHPHFQEYEAFRCTFLNSDCQWVIDWSANADQPRSQAPEDHRCRRGIRHCQVRKSLDQRLFYELQVMRALHFHLMLIFARSLYSSFFKLTPHSKIQLEHSTSLIQRIPEKTGEISFVHFII